MAREYFLLVLLLVLLLVVYLWKQYRNRHIDIKVHLIKDHLRPRDRILDLGSGTGCTASRLYDLGFTQITPLDVVNKSTCMRPALYDGNKIPFPDGFFDVTICAYVLHHVPDQSQLLQEIRRVTRRSIFVFEDTPENEQDWKLARRHAASPWGQCIHCFRSCPDWIHVFEQEKFDVEDIHRIERKVYPFADKPLWYPQLRSCFRLGLKQDP